MSTSFGLLVLGLALQVISWGTYLLGGNDDVPMPVLWVRIALLFVSGACLLAGVILTTREGNWR